MRAACLERLSRVNIQRGPAKMFVPADRRPLTLRPKCSHLTSPLGDQLLCTLILNTAGTIRVRGSE